MTARNIIDANVGGRLVDMLEVTTNNPCKRWIIFFGGTGWLGPDDASQIGDLDDAGYQKNLNFETEFNTLAPQAQKGYSEFEFNILDWMFKTYGEDIEIFLIGHSLGARQVMEYVNKYRGLIVSSQVVGAMPIAGEMSGPYPEKWCDCADIPVIAVVGANDTTIRPVQSEKFVRGLNSCPTRKHKAIIDIVPGANHGSILNVVFAYDRTSKYYQFIMSCFSEDAEVIECVAFLDEVDMKAEFIRPDGSRVTYGLDLIPDKSG